MSCSVRNTVTGATLLVVILQASFEVIRLPDGLAIKYYEYGMSGGTGFAV